MEPKKVGNLINRLRSQKQMTQKQLAEKLNVTDKAVSKWERGECCPDLPLLLMMRDIFDVDIENLMNGEIPPEVQKDLSGAKIRLYDFKRPSIFSKAEMRAIANVFELLEQKIEADFLKFDAKVQIKLASVDELTNEEFIRSIPRPAFLYDFDYNNLGFAIEVDPVIGKKLLKQDNSVYEALTGFDFEVLKNYFVEPVARTMQEAFYEKTNQSAIREDFFKKCTAWGDNFLVLGQNGQQMCCLVTLSCEFSDYCGMINLQFNKDYFCRTLRKLGFFGDNRHVKTLTNIKRTNNFNTFVEFGRFTAEDISFEPDDVIILDRKYKDFLMLIHNNKLVGRGEPVIISRNNFSDTKWGIRMIETCTEDIVFDEKDYIAVRLGSRNLTEEEASKIFEGLVYELDEDFCTTVSVIKNGKKVAHGEIVICGENYGVKILE